MLLGTNLEIQYSLQSFGITSDVLPVDQDGNLLVERHLKYLETCKTQEREQRQRRRQQHQHDSQNKQLLQDGLASISTSSVPGATNSSSANGAAVTSMELDGIACVESPQPNDGK